jgi:ribosome recycling factor
MDRLKRAKAAGMPEDDQKLWADEIQELTDRMIALIDKTLEGKQQEIMHV